MPIRTYYRLATLGDGKLLERNKEGYDGVMVGANLAAYYDSAVASILIRVKKPFFIDPCTAPFGLDLGLIERDGDMRTSYRRLADRIDAGSGRDALARRLDRGRLRPSDLAASGGRGRPTALAKSLVGGTVDLQKKCLDSDASKKNQSIKKYMAILGDSGLDDVPSGVEFIVAPYFYVPNMKSGWLAVNARLHAMTARVDPGAYATLCIGMDVIREGSAERIAAAYPDAGGFLVWVNGFNDAKAGKEDLVCYREFLEGMAAAGRPTMSLYGGYYSAVASGRAGASGFVRGIGSGESRDMELQVRGGGFPKRYYIRRLHTHVMEETAVAALADIPKIRCRCRACRDAMKRAVNGKRPASDADRYRRMLGAMGPSEIMDHFMQAYRMEMRHAEKNGHSGRAAVLGDLSQADVRRASSLGVYTEHLPKWVAALP